MQKENHYFSCYVSFQILLTTAQAYKIFQIQIKIEKINPQNSAHKYVFVRCLFVTDTKIEKVKNFKLTFLAVQFLKFFVGYEIQKSQAHRTSILIAFFRREMGKICWETLENQKISGFFEFTGAVFKHTTNILQFRNMK